MRVAHFIDLKIYPFSKAPSRFLSLCQTRCVPVGVCRSRLHQDNFLSRPHLCDVFSQWCAPSAVTCALGLVLVYATWIRLENVKPLPCISAAHYASSALLHLRSSLETTLLLQILFHLWSSDVPHTDSKMPCKLLQKPMVCWLTYVFEQLKKLW